MVRERVITGVEAKVVSSGEGDDELARLLDSVSQRNVASFENVGRKDGRLVAEELRAFFELHGEVQLQHRA